MNNIERRDAGLPYISDAEVMEQQKVARRLIHELNTVDKADTGILEVAQGKSDAFLYDQMSIYRSQLEMPRHF